MTLASYKTVMDATRLAAGLLEPIPAHQLFGLKVLRAVDGAAEVGLQVAAQMTNVIGSLHSSGLIALVDATALAAIVSAVTEEREFENVTPLGTLAQLEFLAPARGRLIGRCSLDATELAALRALFEGEARKAELSTAVAILDGDASVVCRGTFTWKLRRAA